MTAAREAWRRAALSDAPRLDWALAWMAVEEGASLPAEAMVAALDAMARHVLRASPAADLDDEGPAPGLFGPPGGGDTLAARVARLHYALFETYGFRGAPSEADQPESSLLDHVLTRRRGLPILLSAVYLSVAARVGVPAEGVGFPGHFLVTVQTEPRIWIDPYHGGRPVPRDALAARLSALEGRPPSPRRLASALAPVGPAYVLARVENNLKGARLRRGDLAGALRATERLLEVAPELVEELRDRGMLRIRLGARAEGRADLVEYLRRWSTAPDRERVERAIALAERDDDSEDA